MPDAQTPEAIQHAGHEGSFRGRGGALRQRSNRPYGNRDGGRKRGNGVELAALDLTLYEIANVAVGSWRSTSTAERLIELVGVACPDTLERVDGSLAAAAGAIAAEHGLIVYDAAYVAAAWRRDWTLVSADVADLVRPGHAVAPDSALAG